MNGNKKIKQAVILAGGRGMRLRPFTDDRPKLMVLVNGLPFLEYVFDPLKKNGIEEIVLLLGYLPEKFIEHFGDGRRFGLRIKHHVGKIEDETGARVRNAKNLLAPEFLLMYGDVYWPALNLPKMSEFYFSSGKSGLMAVCGGGESKRNVWVDDKNNVLSYVYGPEANDPKFNWTEVGVFIMSRDIVNFMPEKDNFNLNKATLPDLAARNQLVAWKTDKAPDTITHPAHLSAFARKMIIRES
mgnify:CR=1 FL=1